MIQNKSIEKCGCEFTTYMSEDYQNGFTVLTKCRCQKHYDEQLVWEYYDSDGHLVTEIREPWQVSKLVPLEKEVQ